MDHAVNAIKPYLDVEVEALTEEYHSGKYKSLAECPSYGACKALVGAIHVIEKYYYRKKKTLIVKQLVESDNS